MKKILLMLFKLHKWHKDWAGCFICEYRLRNQDNVVAETPTNV